MFGMSMIFIFVGAITICLDVGSAQRTWLVVLPFVGVLVDILAMWLKAFVSPAFFLAARTRRGPVCQRYLPICVAAGAVGNVD
jgi:hypothetical protein